MASWRLVGVASLALAIISCGGSVGVVKIVEPKDEASCAASAGTWRQDFFRNYFCEMRTTDGGKRCTDSKQCQWACLGPDNAVAGAKATGVCSATSAQFGNVVHVEDGKVVRLNIE